MSDKTPIDNNIVEHNIFKAIRGKCINDDSAVFATKEVMGFIEAIQAKHKEDIKQAVIKAYDTGYNNSCEDVGFENRNNIPNLNFITAKQYYKENYETD